MNERCKILLILSTFISVSQAFIIFNNSTENTTNRFISVPLQFDANPLRFQPVSGFLVLTNMTDVFMEKYRAQYGNGAELPPIILAELYPGYNRPYIETRLVAWVRKFGPQLKGAIILGEYHLGQFYELGALDQIRIGGYSTKEATYPLVHSKWEVWFAVRTELLSGSLNLNVTLTDDGPNPWKALRTGWWFPVWISITMGWSIINIILAVVAVRQYPCERVLSVVVLWLEIASNAMRIPFLMDPYGTWFIPIPLIQVFFSMSWPIHASAAILTIFFWLELVTSRNISVKTGFLSESKWPAAIVIVVLVVAEFATSAARAAGLGSSFLNVNSAIYIIVLSGCFGIYVYVYRKVYIFFRNSPILRTKDSVLQSVSLRFLVAACTFLATIAVGLVSVFPAYLTAVGHSVTHFLIYTTLNLGSSFTISAFLNKPSPKPSTKSESTIETQRGSGNAASGSSALSSAASSGGADSSV